MTRIPGYSHDSVTFPMVREENPGDNLTGCGVLFPEMFKVEKTILGCLKSLFIPGKAVLYNSVDHFGVFHCFFKNGDHFGV